MSLRNVALLSLAFVFTILLSVQAFPQGIIVPMPCLPIRPCPGPRPPRIPRPAEVPVKSITFETTIKGQVAVTRVEQVFSNKTPYTLEGRFFFPIPEEASIEQFAIWEDGKKLSGEVRSREEARRIYDEIVRRLKDPGLLEYAGKDLFQASVFPIGPNSDKKLELTYSQVLKSDSGTVSYSYPLGTASRAMRERTRGGGGTNPETSVSGRVSIESGKTVRNIYSPTHKIDIARSGHNATLSFETKDAEDDFRLYFTRTEGEFGLSLITYSEPGKDGYFLLMLSPNDGDRAPAPVAKDVVFVLDTSGSMQDDGKLEKAGPALIFGINALNPGDRFNVINFSGEEHLMERGLVTADRANKKRAEEFVKNLKPAGGTNINDALGAAVKQFESGDRPNMLVFLTDGLPTVGEQDVDKIISNVAKSAAAGMRLFPFGVGYDVNTRLLDKLGSEYSGLAEYIQPKEDLEVKVSGFFRKINSPVLSGIEIDFGRTRTDKVYPRKYSDIFRGSQLVLIGRFTAENELTGETLKLKGKFGKESRTFSFGSLNFPLNDRANDFLPRLWASRRVGWLIEEIRANGESKELKDEIVDLGTRYGIVTPYTSYLADDGSFRARETSGNRFMIDGTTAAEISGAMKADKGRDAVRQSVQQNALQSNIIAAPSGSETSGSVFMKDSSQNQFVGTKNFINDGGNWIDTEFDAARKLPFKNISFGSDEYFDLALSDQEIARYLALGNNVTVLWKGTVYIIRE